MLFLATIALLITENSLCRIAYYRPAARTPGPGLQKELYVITFDDAARPRQEHAAIIAELRGIT
jgi:hypothetical protein